RLNNVDAFIKEKVDVDKVVSHECKALLRFKKPQKDKIISVLKDKLIDSKVIAQDDELAVVVDAPSECAINDSIKFIEDNNYCEDISKILKLS
ncbi:MAG: homoserine dehydrogenase, partial [Intestinibacter sp.]|nr:homoserine dehydrogenase [Intestinibacter sp.]